MRGFSSSGGFLHRRAAPGVDLFLLPDRRFRTVSIRLNFLQPLAEDAAAALALSGAVLGQGSAHLPSRLALQRELDGLCGTDLEMDTARLGEIHLMEADLALPSERATGEAGLLKKAVSLLAQCLAEPRRQGQGFPKTVLSQERRGLKDVIASARNHRPSWASLSCLRAVCAREPYRIGRLGSPEALDRLTPEGLLSFWRRAASRLPVLAYAVGDFDPSRMADLLAGAVLPLRKGLPAPLPSTGFRRAAPTRPARRVERASVEQARLCLGFRTNTAWSAAGFSDLVMANMLLGGGSHAKLFREVREKRSLAYDASSSLEKTKGLMLVSAGVSPQQADRAEALILEQIRNVQAGRFSSREWRDSLRTLTNRIRTLGDSPSRLVSLHLEGFLNGSPRTPAEVLREARSVTPESAAAAARRWAHAGTFLLTSRGRRRKS